MSDAGIGQSVDDEQAPTEQASSGQPGDELPSSLSEIAASATVIGGDTAGRAARHKPKVVDPKSPPWGLTTKAIIASAVWILGALGWWRFQF